MDMNGYEWLRMGVPGWVCVGVCRCALVCPGVPWCVQMCMGVRGCSRVCVHMCGCTLVCMGNAWVCMDVCGMNLQNSYWRLDS